MLDPIPRSDTDPFFQIKEVTTLMPEEVESIVIRDHPGTESERTIRSRTRGRRSNQRSKAVSGLSAPIAP